MGSLVAQFHHHNFVSIHKMGSRFTLLANISISASPHHTSLISQQEKLVSSYGLGTMAKLHLLFDKKVEKMSRSISSPKAEEVVSVDVSQAKTLLQSGHQYLDVRTQEEFRRGHCEAPKMVNIPYMLNTPQGRVKNQDFLEQVSSHLNPADDILVGCQSGARSLKATTELVAAGYKKVRNVGGGYMAWVDHSYPINKEEALAN